MRKGAILGFIVAAVALGVPAGVLAQPPPPPAPAPYPTYQAPSYAPPGATPTAGAPAAAPAVAPAAAPAPRAYGPPPPPAASQAPLVVYGWDPDVPPPDGYEMDSDVNIGLIGTGAGLLVMGYVTSVLVAVVATEVEEVSDGTKSDWSPLYAPVAGPFVAIGTLDASGSGVGFLLAGGFVQAAGALAIVMGIVDQDFKLVKTAGVDVAPIAAPGQSGLMVRGTF
jgi:hypothetical protein